MICQCGPFNSNCKTNFMHSNQRTKTTLITHVWELKDKGVDQTIRWKILMARTSPHLTPSSKMCRLCLTEKVKIMHTGSTLNKWTEFFSSCRHKDGLLL